MADWTKPCIDCGIDVAAATIQKRLCRLGIEDVYCSWCMAIEQKKRKSRAPGLWEFVQSELGITTGGKLKAKQAGVNRPAS